MAKRKNERTACIDDDPAAMKALAKFGPSRLSGERAGYNAELKRLLTNGGCGSIADFRGAMQSLDETIRQYRSDAFLRAGGWLGGLSLRRVEHLRDACHRAYWLLS